MTAFQAFGISVPAFSWIVLNPMTRPACEIARESQSKWGDSAIARDILAGFLENINSCISVEAYFSTHFQHDRGFGRNR